MVFLSASVRFNQWLGPFLLRWGVHARYVAAGGILRDSPWADAWCFLPIAQKLIQVEVYDETRGKVAAAIKKSPNGSITQDEEVQIRLRVLERYLRPSLVPNERWSDVRRWQFHSRILKWARTEFLIANHGTAIRNIFHTFPTLRKSPQISGESRSLVGPPPTSVLTQNPLGFLMSDDDGRSRISQDKGPAKLPYSSLLLKAFGMSHWRQSKDIRWTRSDIQRIAQQLNGEMLELRGGNVCVARIPDDANLSALTFGEILEVAGGHVIQCGPFNALCEEANLYQFWTRDYVEQLGRYLIRRSSTMAPSVQETLIVDVGAGDGILSQLLREYFDAQRDLHSANKVDIVIPRSPRRKGAAREHQRTNAISSDKKKIPTIIATDDGTWGISPLANVEPISVQDAMNTYATGTRLDNNTTEVIVLCSWMPMNEDWSAIFRNSRVYEYILIGECDDGQCGDNWETWGNHRHLLDDFDEVAAGSESVLPPDIPSDGRTTMGPSEKQQNQPRPPYEIDGYDRVDLDDLNQYQFSRYDCVGSKSGKTVSFRRRRAQTGP